MASMPDDEKILLRHSDGSSTLIIPWWLLEKQKDGRLVRRYSDSTSEALSYQAVLGQAASCSMWYEAEIMCQEYYVDGGIPFCLGHAADFEVARSCLLQYLDSVQSYMNRFFAEIDKAIARKQLELYQQRRKEFLHLVRIAFYNTIVMFIWAFSFHIFAAYLPLATVPFIYAFTYFLAQDILGASWVILWVTIRTILSKESPLQREATPSEKALEQAHHEWNAFKMSAFKRLEKMREVVRQGQFKEGLDTEMEYFGFQSSVWAYLPPTLSPLLFDDESTARFMDSVDFDWGVLHN